MRFMALVSNYNARQSQKLKNDSNELDVMFFSATHFVAVIRF